MNEQEYIVSLHKNVNCQLFNQQMIAHTGTDTIPCRCVNVANARLGSMRNTHYMLTEEEAEVLRSDSRVYAVEIPPEQRNDLVIVKNATQTGNFSKTSESSGSFINWGLRRINETINPYTGNVALGGYNYTLDGTGVDIVIQDSGIQADHPDFNDFNGISRVQQIDWYNESGLPGTMPVGHYTDFDGHGTHCAGIAAGRIYGWAKNAKIYAVKVAGLEGPDDPNTGISISDCFDVIKEWHKNKPIDSSTGEKRPTIVNMSWGYQGIYDSVNSIIYRETTYTGSQIDTAGERWSLGLVPIQLNGRFRTNVRIASVDVDIQEMIDAGIHVVIASGNLYHKIDVEEGLDYNNTAITNTGTRFYHRGSSPFDNEAHIVGNIDTVLHSSQLEQKAESSNSGPGVTIWAPGTNIMSTLSENTIYSSGSYLEDADYKIGNISGTSMAAPQIAGVLALYIQLNPSATPAEAKAWITNTSQLDQIYSTDSSTDYTDTRSILGSSNQFAYNKFNSAIQLKLGANL